MTGGEWAAANFWDGLMRWAVPVFVMISGALFLDPEKDEPVKKLYSKNVLRIATIILFWGFVYALLNKPPVDFTFASLYGFFKVWVLGHYHMWFLYMIAGLYIMVPILRCVTVSCIAMRYFLVVAFVVNSLIPFLTSFGHLSLVSSLLAKMMFEVPVGYSFYFVLGYYLHITTLRASRRYAMYVLGGVGACLTVVLTYFASVSAGEGVQTYYNYLSLPVCLTSAAIFVWAKNWRAIGRSERQRVWLAPLSKSTLGVYLIHIIILDLLIDVGLDSLSFAPLAAIPVTAIVAIVLSFAIALLMIKIPFFNKHFV